MMTVLLPPPARNPEQARDDVLDRAERTSRQKGQEAFRGFKRGFRGQSSYFVHFFYGALALAAGIVLRCAVLEWSLLIACLALVLTTELFNSATRIVVEGLDEPACSRVRPALEISGAAVVVANIAATAIGVLIFLHRLLDLLG
jgi:diacylglycerol kinase